MVKLNSGGYVCLVTSLYDVVQMEEEGEGGVASGYAVLNSPILLDY